MKSENEYIGDDKLKKLLEHYHCPTPLDVVKLRFAGAICSPNQELRPTDVISSFWEPGKSPRLETKKEGELFFKFFMGLWDEMFQKVINNEVSLPKVKISDDFITVCESRYEMIELGFVEGFWGGMADAKLPKYIAEIIDSISQLALLYKSLAGKTKSNQKQSIFEALTDCDKMVNKSFKFLIENYALPHIKNLQRSIN